MYIATVPNRNSPPAILLRQSFRENRKVRNRTLANLSCWPAARIEALRRWLRKTNWPPEKKSASSFFCHNRAKSSCRRTHFMWRTGICGEHAGRRAAQ